MLVSPLKDKTLVALISDGSHVHPLGDGPLTEQTSGYLTLSPPPISPEENPHRSLLLPLSVNGA